MNTRFGMRSIAKTAVLGALLAPMLAIGASTPAYAAERTVYKNGCWVTPP